MLRAGFGAPSEHKSFYEKAGGEFIDTHTLKPTTILLPTVLDPSPETETHEAAAVRLVDTPALGNGASGGMEREVREAIMHASCVVYVVEAASADSLGAVVETYAPLVSSILRAVGRKYVPTVLALHDGKNVLGRSDDILDILADQGALIPPNEWLESSVFVDYVADVTDLADEHVQEELARLAGGIARALFYPLFPLWKGGSRSGFRPRVMAALAQIFVVLDEDENEVLSFEELNTFSLIAFKQPIEMTLFRELLAQSTDDGKGSESFVAGVISPQRLDLSGASSASEREDSYLLDELDALSDEDLMASPDIGIDLTGFMILQGNMIKADVTSVWSALRAYGFDAKFSQAVHPALLSSAAASPDSNKLAAARAARNNQDRNPGEFMGAKLNRVGMSSHRPMFWPVALLMIVAAVVWVLEYQGITALSKLGKSVRALQRSEL